MERRRPPFLRASTKAKEVKNERTKHFINVNIDDSIEKLVKFKLFLKLYGIEENIFFF